MAVKVEDATIYIKKYLFFFIDSTYRLACRHPFASSFAFSLFLLHNCYPSLFIFLVSSSPVLICTALLLGILLCYGDPNIPEIEVEDGLSWKVSSLNVENTLDDLFIKKDKSYNSEGYVDSRFGTKEMTSRDLATDGKNEMVGDFLVVSSSVEEQNNTEEDYIWEHGFVENIGELIKEKSECDGRMSEVADEGSDGVEGLIVEIERPELDEGLDSSLSSPWQHINIHDAVSDSESDQAESSSTDASMTDILPMLNELHPLLNSKDPKSADNSDEELTSEDSVEQEGDGRIEKSNASNEVVTWTADDKRNVMDLGSSDLERNRRLESLIAKRRARKNQIIIYEKDLIDLHRNDTTVDELFRFHPQIPHISAPRRNPFDLHNELEESEGYPSIPGSAPSVLVHQQNPFTFQCDDENGSKGLAGDNLCQTQIGLPSRRGLSFRRYESFSSQSLFPSNVLPEKHGSSSSSGSSRLKYCFVGEAMGLDSNEYVDSDTMTSTLDPNPQKELAKEEICEDTDFPVCIHASKTTVQDGQFYRDDLVNFEAELIDDGHIVDTNASAVTEETHKSINTSVIFKDELERTQIVSNTMLDGQKHELVEEKDEDWTLFTSSEDKEKNLHMSLHEAQETLGQTKYLSEGTSDSVQSSDVYTSILYCETERTDNNQAAVPVYDSSPSGSGNFIANIYVQDDALLSSGGGGPHSTFMEFHVQEDVSEVVSHARECDENLTSEMMELEMVHGNELHNSTYSSEEPVTFSTYINVLDEDILKTKDFSETEEQDVIENISPGLDEDLGGLATSLEIDHSSYFSSGKVDMNDTGVAFPTGLPDLVKKRLSLEKLEMQTSFRTRKFELKTILEENSEEFLVKEELSNLSTSSTGPQVFEEPNVCKPNVGHKIISLHAQSKEAAEDDEGNEEAIFFSPGNAQSPKTFNLVSANDEHISRLLVGGFLDSTEFLDLYKMKSEYESTSNGAINDLHASDINEFHINEDVISRNLNEFCTEPGDVDVDISEIQCFDESLLSELDAVGDFHVEVFKSQQCLRTETQSTDKADCGIGDSELRAANIADTSPNKPITVNPNIPHEMDSVLNPQKTADSGFWSLSMTPVDDLELTVYKSKFNVLQACALEELDSTFKQDPPGEFAEPSETITDNFIEEKPHVGLSRFDMCDQEVEDTPYPSGLTSYISAMNEAEASLTESAISSRDLDRGENDSELVEAKMIEDTDSAFKHVSEMIISNSITPSVNRAPLITHPLDTVVEVISHEVEKPSGLQFLEAKSVEHINSTFEAATKEIPAMPVFCSSDLDSARTHADLEEVELNSPDAETSSELFVLEAKSAEDIQLAFKESKGVSMMPSSTLLDPSLIKATQDLEAVESMCGDVHDNSKLLVPEVKSSKDIDSVFKQFEFEKMITQSNLKLEDDESGPVNAENYTKCVPLENKLIAVTPAFQEAIDQNSDKSTFHQDVYSLNVSDEDVNLNSALEQDNEYSPAHSSQDDPELGYVHPDHENVEKESLQAEDKSEIYSLESKTFEVAHLEVKEASTDSFRLNQEQVVLDEKSPDVGDTSDFFVTETKSLEDDEDYCVKESSFASDNPSELIAVEGKSFVNIHSALSEDTTGVCEVSTSLSADSKPMKTPSARKDGDNLCTETEDNLGTLLIEAKSFEDIASAFKLATIAPPSPQLTDAMPLHSETVSSSFGHEEDSTVPIFSIDPPYGEFMEENSLGNKDSDMLVLEEIPVNDIDSALEQVSDKYLGSSVTPEDDSKPKTQSELQNKDSELFIVEQISVSDSDVIVKQDTDEGNKETATSKTEDGSTSDETVIRTSEKEMDKRTDEEETLSAENEEIVTEEPGFSAPISLNIKKKKKKYEKSDSSSSSSSSSSDTE